MSIARIRQILETWEQITPRDTNQLLELVSLTIRLLQTLYTRDVIRQLPEDDLIEWVITLNETIETQVKAIFEVLEAEGINSQGQTICNDSPQQQYRDWETDRKSTRLNSSHSRASRMPSSA